MTRQRGVELSVYTVLGSGGTEVSVLHQPVCVCVGRSCMVEESGTLESQLEATKVTQKLLRTG